MKLFCDLCKKWDPCDRPGCRIVVNKSVVNIHVVNASPDTVVNTKRRYPDTDARRAYMKAYMKRKRSK